MRLQIRDNLSQTMTLILAIIIAALSIVIALKLAWRYL